MKLVNIAALKAVDRKGLAGSIPAAPIAPLNIVGYTTNP